MAWRVTITCLFNGQVCQNVLHFITQGAAVMTGPTVAAEIRDNFIQTYRPFQTSSAKWIDIEARDLDQPALAAFHLTVNILGSGASQVISDDSVRCRVFQLKTAFAGRSGHGRLFGIGTPVSTWDTGVVGAASVTAGQTQINLWKARYVTQPTPSNLIWVVGPRKAPFSWKPVVDVIQRPTAGFQKRRAIGIGI